MARETERSKKRLAELKKNDPVRYKALMEKRKRDKTTRIRKN